MKEMNRHIKSGDLKQIYLLYGEEDYLKKTYKKRLKDAIVAQEDNMNYNYFMGTGINFKEVIDIAETMPFFAEKRLIIIEDSGAFKKPKEEITEYISSVPEESYFIFVENEVDKRGKLFKRVKEKGYVCELTRQTEAVLSKWILEKILSEHKKITSETMKLFLLKTGFSMENISKELEKLLCYTLGREEISNEDVENICTADITGKIFDMIDAMSVKNKERLFSLYYDLLMVKEPPMRILYMVGRQFNIMLQVKDLSEKGAGKDVIIQNLKMHSFVAGKTINQVRNFSKETIQKALEELLEIEEKIKTGYLDEKIGLELFFVKYCQ